MKTVAVIQARMGSSRLPGKILKPLAGLAAIGWTVRAAQTTKGVDEVIIATTQDPKDELLVQWCIEQQVPFLQGSESDVLSRVCDAARSQQADVVVRLTGDCPFLDPDVIGAAILYFKQGGFSYVTNTHPATWPDGLDIEVVSMSALQSAEHEAETTADREHVTRYVRANRDRFPARILRCPVPGLADHRWTLDTEEDFEFLSAIAENLPTSSPPSYIEVLDVIETRQDDRSLAEPGKRNAKAAKDRKHQNQSASYRERSYNRSLKQLRRAEKSIPLGSQTFSKSRLVQPVGAAPLFLSHGSGGWVWDVDGNEYIDLVTGLLSNILGYCDPDVDDAVRTQMDSGVSFSMPSVLETRLAEKLCEIIPCAESVRFGKNGTDATSAAVRVARAFTCRDRIAVAGYHGWQDWYIGTTARDKGVPKAFSALTHRFPYNDVEALRALLEKHQDEFAAVMMEPLTDTLPHDNYFEQVQKLCKSHGVLLIFDEMITGFRLALGGAQEYLGVVPDLACFGKAMANGYPLSALVGREDILAEMEHVFISSTFGGEAVSLAASIAVIEKMQREPVIDHLWETGKYLRNEAEKRIKANGLEDTIRFAGVAPWSLIRFQAAGNMPGFVLQTAFVKYMSDCGVMVRGSHNICYAHDDAQVTQIIDAYDYSLSQIKDGLNNGTLESNLQCEIIRPVFEIRPEHKP